MKTLLELNLVVSVAFLLWKFFARTLTPSQTLRITHLLVVTVLAIPVALLFVQPAPFTPLTHMAIQIWSGPSVHTRVTTPSPIVALSNQSLVSPAKLADVELVLLALLALGALAVGYRLIAAFRSIREILKRSHLARRIGSIEIRVSAETSVPFSYWLPGTAYVVLPESFVSDAANYRLAVLHELQHHRQGDTAWVHVLQALKLGLFWNPLFHLWEQGIASLQEFACDEALVDLKQVSPHAYGGCLLKAAEQSLRAQRLPVGTTGMALGTSGKILKRRIDMMFDPNRKQVSRWIAVLSGTVGVIVLGSVAFASQNLVHDRRISLIEARQLAAAASANNPFPIVVNADVVEELNRFVGTPDGREFIRASMARMQNYRTQIEGTIQSYEMPTELMAVPIVESGYQNVTQTHGAAAAGLWMFIPSTARHYGLRVDDQHDDRLNIASETDAAMRYLDANYLRFQDWQLAILAYNMGESQVQKAIDTTGSRDAWQLIHAGYEGDKNYLASFMASVLILKNPSLYN